MNTDNEWRTVAIKDIAAKRPDAFTDGDWIEAPFITTSGIRLIQTGNIGIGAFNDKNQKFISEESFTTLNCKDVFEGDILICRLADPIGRSCIVPNLNSRAITSVDICILRVDAEKYDRDFVAHALNQDTFLAACQEKSGGSTQQRISRTNLGTIEIFAAKEKAEQTQIAAILSTIDKAIAQTEAIIAKQQRIKTALMQDLLTRGIDEHGNIRSEETHAFKDSPLGRIPVEWEVTPAFELCQAVIDCKNRTPPPRNEGHPVIRTPNVRDGVFVYENLAFTDPISYEIWTARGKPRPGDVVITREAPFGEACIIPGDMPNACLGQRMMMYQPNPQKINSQYLVQAIYSDALKAVLLALAGGSTVGHIRADDIRTLPIPHPKSVKEQLAIANTLEGIENAISCTALELRKLRRQKTSLMQDLLTGKVRVTPLLEATGA